MINDILLRDITSDDIELEEKYHQEYLKCKEQGNCPTCANFKTNNIFIEDDELTLYEDNLFRIFLERNARKSGHVIIIVKDHYEDISEMPISLAEPFHRITNITISALKEVLGALKVYLVTMCDGGPNHLHFQLIPRYEGEPHGSKVFVTPRRRIKKDMEVISSLKEYIRKATSN